MTHSNTTPRFTSDILPAGTFHGSWWHPREQKEAPVVEYPSQQIEILPPASYPVPARAPARPPAPQPMRDEIPDGTFHARSGAAHDEGSG